MQIGNFEVRITPVHPHHRIEEPADVPGLVRFFMTPQDVSSGIPFRFVISNYDSRRGCEFDLYQNAQHQGHWQMEAYRLGAQLERPMQGDGLFTFFMADSAQGHATGADSVGQQFKGLTQVVFYPEIVPVAQPLIAAAPANWRQRRNPREYGQASFDAGASKSPESSSYSADEPGVLGGATRGADRAGHVAMTGQSNQRFGQARVMVVDRQNPVSIALRLVGVPVAYNEDPRPLPCGPAGNVPPPAPWR